MHDPAVASGGSRRSWRRGLNRRSRLHPVLVVAFGLLAAGATPEALDMTLPAQESSAQRAAPPLASSRLVRAAAAAESARPRDVSMPGDRPLRVALAAPSEDRAIVYLHGMCGAEEGADVWADRATAHGTLITLRADVPCGDRPGYKWPKDAGAIQARIERALTRVGELRGSPMRTEDVWLIGYSQGAHRAERVAAAYPHLYRTLALGGPPTAASPERLRHARHIAVFGGEFEDTSHMVEGYLQLYGAGLDTRFFTLPRAGHGGFGPEGPRVMSEIFSFLAASSANEPDSENHSR